MNTKQIRSIIINFVILVVILAMIDIYLILPQNNTIKKLCDEITQQNNEIIILIAHIQRLEERIPDLKQTLTNDIILSDLCNK